MYGQINDTKHSKTFISRPFGNSLDLRSVGDLYIIFVHGAHESVGKIKFGGGGGSEAEKNFFASILIVWLIGRETWNKSIFRPDQTSSCTFKHNQSDFWATGGLIFLNNHAHYLVNLNIKHDQSVMDVIPCSFQSRFRRLPTWGLWKTNPCQNNKYALIHFHIRFLFEANKQMNSSWLF